MSERVKVAVIGVGNNVSALVQGIALSRTTGSLDGVRRPTIDGIGVGDVDFVAAFATSPEKIGRDLSQQNDYTARDPDSRSALRAARLVTRDLTLPDTAHEGTQARERGN